MLTKFENVVLLLSLAVFAYLAWNIASQYHAATGSIWTRLLASARNSATVLWSKFCFVLSLIIANLDTFANYLGAPEVGTFINTWVGNPKSVAAVMAIIAGVSMMARLRTL